LAANHNVLWVQNVRLEKPLAEMGGGVEAEGEAGGARGAAVGWAAGALLLAALLLLVRALERCLHKKLFKGKPLRTPNEHDYLML
jgi:hypothetical protein